MILTISLAGMEVFRDMSDHGSRPATPRFVLSTEGELYGEDTPDNREIVRRIHACVSACEGISTEELERGIVRDMQQAIRDVLPLLSKSGLRNAMGAQNPLVIDAHPQGGAQAIPA